MQATFDFGRLAGLLTRGGPVPPLLADDRLVGDFRGQFRIATLTPVTSAGLRADLLGDVLASGLIHDPH